MKRLEFTKSRYNNFLCPPLDESITVVRCDIEFDDIQNTEFRKQENQLF